MDSKNFSITSKVTSFILEKDNILLYDANSKIIYLSKEYNSIETYSIDTKTKISSKKLFPTIIHFQSHPKYCNILAVSLMNSNVLLFHIDIDNKTIEQKFIYKNQNNGMIIKTIFCPYGSGTVLASLFYGIINIWDINSYYHIYNIYFDNNIERSSNPEIKWSESGEYLIFQRYKSLIEIFSLVSKKIEYSIESKSKHYFLLSKEKKIILYELGNIFIYDITNNKQLYKINCDINLCEKSFLSENNSLFYLLNEDKIFVYDLISKNKIFEYNIKQCKNFVLLKDNNKEPKLLSKLILYSRDKNFEIISIYKENYVNVKEYIEEIASNDFWEKSIKTLDDNYEYFSYKYNRFENDRLRIKKYLSIREIKEEFDNLLKNKELEEKRELVKINKVNFTKNDDISKIYIYYIKNLIKDNTNTELLINYLSFLQENNDKLQIIYGRNFENFDDEIEQFQICFNQSILKEKFKYIKIKSEKEQLLDLFYRILKTNDFGDLKVIIEQEKKILDKFNFNQPISFENKELYFCQNKLIIYNSLKDILEYKDIELLENMKYCINKVLDKNLLDAPEILDNCLKVNLIFILISSPQNKLITDYNFNLINDKDYNVTEEILIQLKFKYDKNKDIYEYKEKKIRIQKDEIKKLNLENLKLIINNESKEDEEFFDEFKNIKNYELYKYDAKMEYYQELFDENNVREFISFILTSNVIKESFRFFYGDDIRYPFFDNENKKGKDKALEFLKKYLKFIPFKFYDKSAITNKFTMETYIVLNSKMSTNVKKCQNINIDYKLISKALINGSIVIININELNHNFHNYYNLSQNGKESLKVPRKNDIEDGEDEFIMEKILFGNVLNNLTLRQTLYILNEENYKKPLYKYCHDFSQLKYEDCECKGTFEDYSIIKVKDLGKFSDTIKIRFKPNSYNTPSISIYLKNDVLGFRSFHSTNYYQ